MRYLFPSVSAWLLASVAVVGVGCRNGENGVISPSNETQISTTNTGGVTSKTEKPSPEDVVRPKHPKLPRKFPKVGIDEDPEKRQQCRVYLGDSLPEVTLPDLEGNPYRLQDLYGEKLTVILFWSSDKKYAVQALGWAGDTVGQFRKPYTEKEARLIGVNVGDTPEDARQVVEDEGAEFINLLDKDGSLFDQVATQGLPRVYLLDAEGVIRWLDDHYSTTTEDALEQAMGAVLPQEGGSEEPGEGDRSP
jgi:peroxiredoxin